MYQLPQRCNAPTEYGRLCTDVYKSAQRQRPQFGRRARVAGLVRGRSIAGDCYSGFLDHQHLRGLQCHWTVPHPARNRECHAGSQFHCVATFEFDAQAAVDDVEELVLLQYAIRRSGTSAKSEVYALSKYLIHVIFFPISSIR
jgi:hypothetical protein